MASDKALRYFQVAAANASVVANDTILEPLARGLIELAEAIQQMEIKLREIEARIR